MSEEILCPGIKIVLFAKLVLIKNIKIKLQRPGNQTLLLIGNKMSQSILEKFQAIKSKNILVVGDIIFDKYVVGKTERLSPEAPVPILKSMDEYTVPGGAANVAINLKAMGHDAFLVGALGTDNSEDDLKLLRDWTQNFLIDFKQGCTPTKTRFISNRQQILRIDKENTQPISIEHENTLKAIDFNFDMVVVSDYNKGTITPRLYSHIVKVCQKNKTQLVVAPKKNVHFYKGANILVMNKLEYSSFVPKNFKPWKGLRYIVVTCGEDGIEYFNWKKVRGYHKAEAKYVIDVTGAGDTTLAALTSCLSNDFDIDDATYVANIAGSLKVQKFGTGIVTKDEIIQKLLWIKDSGKNCVGDNSVKEI